MCQEFLRASWVWNVKETIEQSYFERYCLAARHPVDDSFHFPTVGSLAIG